MRLFIAFGLSSDLHADLKKVQQSLERTNARLTMTRSFHQTLKFLGNVSPEKLELLKERLLPIIFSPFRVSLGELGVFPNLNEPKVIWIDLNPKKEIMDVQAKIDNALADLFPKEIDFVPHITLARARSIGPKFSDQLKEITLPDKKVMEIQSFSVYSSLLTSAGPIYEKVITIPPR